MSFHLKISDIIYLVIKNENVHVDFIIINKYIKIMNINIYTCPNVDFVMMMVSKKN